MKKKRIVPEFEMQGEPPRRAGFIPYEGYEPDVELWQVWLRSADGEDNRRATFGDMESAGFKAKKGSRMFDKKKTKPKPRPGY